jgi:hypothetical protein
MRLGSEGDALDDAVSSAKPRMTWILEFLLVLVGIAGPMLFLQ